MQCFSHPDRAAVGLCKACSKGLCAECAADLGHGLACKGTHEAAVEQLHNLVERNSRIAKVNSFAKYTWSIVFTFMGLVVMSIAANGHQPWYSGLYLYGGGCIALAVWLYFMNRRARV